MLQNRVSERRASPAPLQQMQRFSPIPDGVAEAGAFLGRLSFKTTGLCDLKELCLPFRRTFTPTPSPASRCTNTVKRRKAASSSSRTPHYPEHKLCLKSHVRRSVGIGTIYIRKDWLITINWQRPSTWGYGRLPSGSYRVRNKVMELLVSTNSTSQSLTPSIGSCIHGLTWAGHESASGPFSW